MKTKLVFLLACLVVSFSFSSCMEETEINSGDPIDVPEGTAALKLVFKGLGTSQAKSYATASLEATADESQLDSVRIYIFNYKGVTGDLDTLENIYTVKPALNSVSGEYEGKVLLHEEGMKRIVAIGNPDIKKVPGLMETPIADISYEEFKELTTLASDQMPVHPFVMYGEVNQEIKMNKAITLSIDLSRLVARIDIVNRDSLGNNNHRFILEKARLMKAASGSYLVPQPTTPEVRLLENLPWIANTVNTGTGVMNGMMQSVIYTYTNMHEGQTYLQIAGKFNGKPAQYDVPFEGVKLNPNNLYVVTIDSVESTTVHSKVYVREWESDTISFTPTADSIPVVTVTPGGLKALLPDARPEATPGSLLPDGSSYYKTDTIWFKNNALDTVRFEVKNENVQVVFHSDSEWATAEEVKSTYSTVKQEFLVTVQKNNHGIERMAYVEFRNGLKESKFVRYCFKQAGVPLVDLAKWAEYNLTGLNQPADLVGWSLSEDSNDPYYAGARANYGKLFQWGRNVPFTNYRGDGSAGAGSTENMVASAERSVGGPVAPNSTAALSTNFIQNKNSPYNWMNGGVESDTWKSVAAQVGVTNAMAAAGMGADDLDPCPPGWRLPTAEEILEIMPLNSTLGAYSAHTSLNQAEMVTYYDETGAQVTKSVGPSSYFVPSGNTAGNATIYGVKKLGTELVTAYRWQHKGAAGSRYLKITALKVGADFNPTQLSDMTALAWDGPDAVVRLFPAADHRQYTGLPYGRDEGVGAYWSSSASTATNAWYLLFYGSYAYLASGYRAGGYSVRCVAQ